MNEFAARFDWRKFLQSTQKDGSTAPWLLGGLTSILAVLILIKSRPKLRSKLQMLGPPLKQRLKLWMLFPVLPSKQSPSQSGGAPWHHPPSEPEFSGSLPSGPDHPGAQQTQGSGHDHLWDNPPETGPDHTGAPHTHPGSPKGSGHELSGTQDPPSGPDHTRAHPMKRSRHDQASGPDNPGAKLVHNGNRSGGN
jgi:hypothetical protein